MGDLGQDARVVFYDQRGTGRSGPLAAGQSCSFEDQISDLEALRVHLASDQMDLIGHSWGGFLGMAYAARFPQHIAHLVLVDSVPTRWRDIHSVLSDLYPDLRARQLELTKAAQGSDSKAVLETLRLYLSMLFHAPEKRDAFLRQFSPASVNEEVKQTILTEVASVDLGPEVGKFPFSTLVLNGRFDADITPAVALELQLSIPHSRLHIFERSGHMPFYEEPDEFVRVLDGFLERPRQKVPRHKAKRGR